ncbi:MAG TPA: hypothetical protein VNR60_06970 [Croceibacterium sp.]|nr:hypothetical protein [Croceibacterium sp.]
MQGHTVRRCARLFATAVVALAIPLTAVSAQDRDLDRETPQGKVFRAEMREDGEPARFRLTLQGGQGLELTAAQVGGSDPYLRVFDADSDELLAENDDSAGSLSASTRLFFDETKRLRIEVTNAVGETGGRRFDLIVLPSDYRPTPPRDLAIGETLSGELSDSDGQLFHVRAERGQILIIAMNQADGSNVDPGVEIYSGNNATGEALASDDDGGGGLNARLRFTVPQSGRYTVRAYGVGGSTGAYSIAINGLQAADIAPKEVQLGSTTRGSLDSDVRERLYKLDQRSRTSLANGSGSLVIEMRSTGASDDEEGLDPVVDVGFETPIGFSSMARDDDGGGGTDAQLVFDVSELDADWLSRLLIKASAYGDNGGEYALTVKREDAE